MTERLANRLCQPCATFSGCSCLVPVQATRTCKADIRESAHFIDLSRISLNDHGPRQGRLPIQETRNFLSVFALVGVACVNGVPESLSVKVRSSTACP